MSEQAPDKTKFNALITLSTNALSAGIALFYGIFAARWFGAEGRGQVVAFMYWPTILTVVALMGVPAAATYYSAHKKEVAPQIIGSGLLLMALSGLVWTTVVGAVAPGIVGGGQESELASRLFALIILIAVVLNVVYHPLRVMGHFALWNFVRLLIDSTPMLALVALVSLSSRSLVTYAILMVSFQGLVMVTALILVKIRVGIKLNVAWVKPLLRYGLPAALAAIPVLLNFRVDQAFLVSLVESAELGNYAAAISWSQAIIVVTNVINYLTLPRVAHLSGQARLQEYENLLRLATLMVILTAIPLAIASPFAVPLLFGPEFKQAGLLALILVPGSALMGLSSLSEEILRSKRVLRGPLIAQLSGLVMTLLSLAVFVPIFGVWGAATVSALVNLFVMLVLNWFLRSLGLPATAPFLRPQARQFATIMSIPRSLRDRVRGKGQRDQ